MTAAVTIIPVTKELLDIEQVGVAALAEALTAVQPPQWPPEFNGEAYRSWQNDLLTRHPEDPGWAGYYVIGNSELMGTCGFKGPPDEAGLVEIGYSIVAPRRQRGFASAAALLLVKRAFADPRVSSVIAETLIDGGPSQGVLRRCGFEEIGTRSDPVDGEVVRFELRRPE